MNKHRTKQHRFSYIEKTLLGLAALVFIAGGIWHAKLGINLNGVKEDIDQLENSIKDKEELIKSIEVSIQMEIDDFTLEDYPEYRPTPPEKIIIIKEAKWPKGEGLLGGQDVNNSNLIATHP